MAGVDMGPAALRVARLKQRIGGLGYSVRDLGDMRLNSPELFPKSTTNLNIYLRSVTRVNNSAHRSKVFSTPANCLSFLAGTTPLPSDHSPALLLTTRRKSKRLV